MQGREAPGICRSYPEEQGAEERKVRVWRGHEDEVEELREELHPIFLLPSKRPLYRDNHILHRVYHRRSSQGLRKPPVAA